MTHARSRVKSGKVGVVGYCLGGSYAWLSATRLPVYLYDAGHGFNCPDRPSYSEAAAALALSRSLAFLRKTLLPA